MRLLNTNSLDARSPWRCDRAATVLLARVMDRRAKAFSIISVAAGEGVEIGPLATPFVRRSDGRVLYADHVSTAELRKKYEGHGWDTSTIVDVDLVLNGAPLAEQLGEKKVDYVIASHVIEHVPDVITWLNGLGNSLRLGGVVCLIIPDKRFCFDAKRSLTMPGELIAAHLERRTAPTSGQVFDFWSQYCAVDCAGVWSGRVDIRELPPSGTSKNALQRARAALSANAYTDVHCWVFTPRSFLEALAVLAELELVSLKPKQLYDTERGDLEFFVALEPTTATDVPGTVARAYRTFAARAIAEPSPVSVPEVPAPVVGSTLPAFVRPAYGRLKQAAPNLVAAIKGVVGRR